ncbi:MAG: hypothetical protein CMJ77_06205 [Planctomycetaceae bacterium]|nr:hypothetical protein [Planctomycetaceae bacterium]
MRQKLSLQQHHRNRSAQKNLKKKIASVRSLETLEPRTLLAADLVSHWTADSLNDSVEDGQPVTAWVDSESNVNAVGDGSPTLIKDALSGRSVVRFDASDGADGLRISAADSPLTGANDFSVAVVFSTASTNLAGGVTNWFENSGIVDANRLGFAKDWGLSINSDGQLASGLGAGLFTPAKSVYTDGGFNDGDFHLAVVSRSGGNLDIYVDDGTASSLTGGDASPLDSVDLTFGYLQGSTNPLTGDIAEIRIYNGAMDATEVGELHQLVQSTYNNEAPVAGDDSYDLEEEPFIFFRVPDNQGVLLNDSDPESNPLVATLATGAQNGSLTLDPGGGFIYAPKANFFGVDSFTYTAYDGQNSNVATVTLNVANKYDPAVAVADSYKAVPSEVLSVSSTVGVLANDENPDQAELSAVVSQDVGQGSLSLAADGSFSYDPQGFAGTTSFRYRINDGTNNSNEVEVTLIVNTPPTASNDAYEVTEDIPLATTAATGVISNDSDADSNPVTATLIAPPTQGTLTFNEDGSFNYEPNTDYVGSDEFTYQLSDGGDDSQIATVSLNVVAVDDSPIANSDGYFGGIGESISADVAGGVLANDTDVDSNSLEASLVTGPASGTLNLNADGSFNYSPAADFQGTVTFTYVASDGNSDSAAAEVSLFVGQPPVRISEVLVANATSIETRVRASVDDSFKGDRTTPDWIELQNLTSSELDISGFHLTDNDNNLTKWAFPAGTMIAGNGYLVVAATRLDITNTDLDESGMLHTNFKLNPSGEYLAITSPDGVVFDEFAPEYPDQRADISYGVGSDGKVGYLRELSPNGPNGGLYAGMVTDTAFSIDRGYYTEPFQVEVSTAFEGAQIRYTTDGSAPTATHGEVYSGPITISDTTVLRAVAVKENYIASNVDAQTYVFAASVFQQDGAELNSARWGHAGPDWQMDPIIINHEDPEIRPELDDLKRIPTVSLSLDFDEFFGSKGIYIRGENVEKPISFEFFDPNKPDNGVQANSTVQIVGGSSPNRWKSDKLSMRVRFTEDQGPSDLNYPVFGADAISQFDTLVVDARLNNVWHYGGGSDPDGQRGRGQYMRDEFAADLQNAVGGYATHGQHVHVYINGIYWGMHTLHERPDDNFMASYHGGVSEDYNVIKHGANEVIAGSNESYRAMFDVVGRRGDDLTDEKWEQIQTMLDMDGFIRYMLVNFYGGNGDWDHHNWYASENKDEGLWRFHSWDAEKVLERVRDNSTSNNNPFAPSGLHRRLSTHPEYKLMFADRVQELFYHGGPMSPEGAAAIYNGRADQIDLVMRVESARWGDNQVDRGRRIRYTRPHWVDVRDSLNDTYFPQRTDTVLSQFERLKLVTVGEAPEFSINDSVQHGGFVEAGSQLTMSAPDGDIYYTTDGSDPRLPGDVLAETAIQYTGAVNVVQSTNVRARLRKADGTWSAISSARFFTSVPATTDNLRISELHYHPADPSQIEIDAGFDNSDDFEFIELVNLSDEPVDLVNVSFQKVIVGDDVEGIDFAFRESNYAEIQPGERVVVVENLEAFQVRYGADLPVAGQWSGRLGNNSERVFLAAGETVLHDFVYDEDWHPTTDGDGPSLQVVKESAANLETWNAKEGWRPSSQVGGSPGREDTLVDIPGDSNRDGVFNSSDLVLVFQVGKYEDGIVNNATFEEGDWNGDGEFDSSDLVYAFTEGNYVDAAAIGVLTQLDHAKVAASLDHDPIVDEELTQNRAAESTLPVREDATELQLLIQARESVFDSMDQDIPGTSSSELDNDLLDQLASEL